jgi:long-subunit fatty acid transport protein
VPGLGTCRYDTAFDIIFPQSVGAGIRHELCPHRIVSVDVVWYNWANAFNNMDITLTNPSVGYFPSIVEQLPLNWRDSVSTKFGFEQVLSNGHVARCGYIYNNNPVPNGTLSPYIQATLEHSMTLGYGLNVKGWDLDFSYMYCFTGDRHVDTSELAGGDFSNSIQRAQCHSGAFSFSKKY